MSSRGRSRGRGYFGRGSSGGSATYRHREELPHSGSHRGGGIEHHNSHYRGAHFNHRGGGGGGEYIRHKEIGAAPPHHANREHHSSRGDERYHHHSRSGSISDRGYEHHSAGGSRRSPPPPHHRRPSPPPPPRRPEHILAKLAPDEQVALTKALVATVLRGSDGRDGGRGYRDERVDMRGMRDDRERGFREDVGGRDYRERRPPSFVAGASPRYTQGRGGYREDRGRSFYRGRSFRGGPRGGHHDLGPHQRLSIPYRGGQDGTGVRRRYADYEQSEQPYKRQRVDSSAVGEDDTAVAAVKGEPRGSQDRDTDEDETASKAGADEDGVKAATADAAGGEDGDKAADTSARQGGEADERRTRREGGWYKQFVELECPHCPSHCSITYLEYKQHLKSDQHLRNMDRLANRQSLQLLRIRKEQRAIQKKLEDSYLMEHPDQGEISVSRFCGTCKLNFRCLGGDVKEGVNAHRTSRLHKMLYSYVHPRCTVCHQKGEEVVRFNTRMVYEHHLASISHMKRKAEKLEQFPEDTGEEEDDKTLDGFMTLDSVGEDVEGGSELDDGAGGASAATDDASVKAEPDHEEDEADLHRDQDDGSYEPVGLSYVKAIKTYYCRLCYLNVKEEGVKHHCTTPSHRNKYFKARDAALAAAAASAAAAAASSTPSEEGGESRPAGAFPRSGGRAGSRHEDEEDEEEEEEEDGSKEGVKRSSSARPSNGDKVEHDEAMDQDGDREDKDDSEKSYEDYNDKYEFPDPRQEDYEEEMEEEGVEEEEDEDHLWDYQTSKRSKKEDENGSANDEVEEEEETASRGAARSKTSSSERTEENVAAADSAVERRRSQKTAERKEETDSHRYGEENDEKKDLPKPMKRRLRSARNVAHADQEEGEDDVTTAEEVEVEETKEKLSTQLDPDDEATAEDVDTDED